MSDLLPAFERMLSAALGEQPVQRRVAREPAHTEETVLVARGRPRGGT